MKSKCCECQWIKEYIDVGPCPKCGADHLLMSRKNSLAICDVCKADFGIPMGIEWLCEKEMYKKSYTIYVYDKPDNGQMLGLSKLLGLNGAEIYRLFKSYSPVVLRKVPILLAYKLRKFFRENGMSIYIDPSIENEYHLFERCHKI